jgi:3-deoxy-D-arabino-heptulosonate 7-phosphate (DAHP) synthase class II
MLMCAYGVHLECTGDAVTECVGGDCAVDENDLPHNYESTCDPKLNASQSVQLAQQMSAAVHSGQDGPVLLDEKRCGRRHRCRPYQ